MNYYHTLLTITLIYIAVMTAIRYFIYRRQRKTLSKEGEKIHEFLTGFDPSSFSDFSVFNFTVGRQSFIAPFPNKEDGAWKYTIYLSPLEVEDLTTITHEITECTVGRLIEKLLNLEKPLYLKRKEEDKFWVHGKSQQYLLEHVVTTLSEIGQVESEKLKERFSKEDFEHFINNRS